MTASASTLDVDDRANRLYWGSDRSVNRIAEELDLSKGALYELIRPLAAEKGCPRCSDEVVYPNRTAREREVVDCPACEWTGPLAEADTAFAPHLDAEAPEARRAAPYAPRQATPSSVDGGRLVLGGALLGAAVGLALVLWARRR